eukprot:2008460-Amphidinium_carterae.1
MYTRRGLGVGKGIRHMGRVVGLVHCLARHRPGGCAHHLYTSMMINHTPELAVHRDDYNSTLNWLLVLDSGQEGGELWIDSCSSLRRVAAESELPLNSNAFVSTASLKCGVPSRALPEVVSLSRAGLAVHGDIDISSQGYLVKDKNAWVCLDSRRPHGVCPVKKSYEPKEPAPRRMHRPHPRSKLGLLCGALAPG